MRGHRARRLMVTLIDQFSYSALSFVTTMLVASHASAKEFGDFALLQVGFTLVLGLARTTVGQTTLLESRSVQGAVPSTGVMLTTFLGVAVSCLLWVPYVIVGSTPFFWVGLLGTSLVPMISLDVVRHALHGLQRHGAAGVASGVGALAYAGTVGVGWITGAPLAASAIGAMSIGAGTGVAVGVFLLPGIQPPAPLRPWLAEQGKEWRDTAAGFAANSAGFILVPVILAIVAGSVAAGALRAGQVIVGFAQQFPNGMSMLMLERSATAVSRGSARMLGRLMLAWSLWTLPIFLALLGGSTLWPQAGHRLLGETWPQTSQIVLPLLISGFLTCVSLGLEVQLRALRTPRVTAYARAAGVVSICVAVAVGARTYGLEGGVAGLLCGNCVQVIALAWGRRRVIGAKRW
jgi:O-antigen/teichoic acid export membrane protein